MSLDLFLTVDLHKITFPYVSYSTLFEHPYVSTLSSQLTNNELDSEQHPLLVDVGPSTFQGE